MGPIRCTYVALGFKGSERGSKLGPVANTRCTPVALGYKGSEWGSKLGCLDSEIQYVG